MINVIRAAQRHTRKAEWLQTAWLFSFDDYYDPENTHFSALRVFNDDLVQPGKGFPLHPHQEAEIITIPLQGELTHEDSLGNRGVIHAGEVQRMTAGAGVRHAEMNLGGEPVHLYQIWFTPDTRGLPPSYEQGAYDQSQLRNRLAPIASGQGIPATVRFHADATLYRAALARGQEIDYPVAGDRCVFLYLTEGALRVNDTELAIHDQGRISGEAHLRLHANDDSSFVLIDLPPCAA